MQRSGKAMLILCTDRVSRRWQSRCLACQRHGGFGWRWLESPTRQMPLIAACLDLTTTLSQEFKTAIGSTWVCLKIGYIPNYSHLIGIMISKTIGFRGTQHFQTHPHRQYIGYNFSRWVIFRKCDPLNCDCLSNVSARMDKFQRKRMLCWVSVRWVVPLGRLWGVFIPVSVHHFLYLVKDSSRF